MWPHPTTHQPVHPPIGGGATIDHKSANRIKLSQLVQELFHLSDLKPPGGWIGGDLHQHQGQFWYFRGAKTFWHRMSIAWTFHSVVLKGFSGPEDAETDPDTDHKRFRNQQQINSNSRIIPTHVRDISLFMFKP